MKRLLVIAGASLDKLHLKNKTVSSAGGSGLYTSLAARRCGIQTSMFGLRPDPWPDSLRPAAAYLSEWIGPVVSPDQLPQFEISYREGITQYLKIYLGAEALLLPEQLPDDMAKYDCVHVAAIRDAQMQLTFVQACRERGAKWLSAGTYPKDAVNHPQDVLALLEATDYFFLNLEEARATFGSLASTRTKPGKLLFVTLGALGACIVQGDRQTTIPAVPADEVDPTGAGDTFCGATLAFLLQGLHPVMAARHAAALAAEEIGQVGPAALMTGEPYPQLSLDPRVRVNHEQVGKVAEKISSLDEAASYPFVSPELPPVGHPKTVDYFFASTLQQFGFWSIRNSRYHRPLIAKIGGLELKGSDYLWQAYTRRLEWDPEFYSPERQANLSREEMLEIFRSDDGQDPMPALDLHLEQARAYGRDMVALRLTPKEVLQRAIESPEPLRTFLGILDHVGGYKEDPLRKKSSLLALILKDRPEGFFPLPGDEDLPPGGDDLPPGGDDLPPGGGGLPPGGGDLPPIIDYHLMRSFLRVGLVEVIDDDLSTKIQARQVLAPPEEWAVRYAAYLVVEQLVALSSKSLGAVDALFFNSRRYCPEMTEPDCSACLMDPVCAHHKTMFQPVLRTTDY